MSEKPIINLELCDGCGLCVAVCCQGGLILVGEVLTLATDVECDWCAECETVCPQDAISCPFEIIFE